ncbi:MAG: DNA repair protein RadC [Deltaproteobacteria bacterium]|nr:DNA repair protein RadC [Deltaproteobacteria bacterium]
MRQTSFIEPTEKSFWQSLKSGRFARMLKEESKGQELGGPHEVYNIVKPIFAENSDVERMYGIFLDTRNRILAIEKLSTGSITSSAVYPREIVKKVLSIKAGAMVITHNHPSGHLQPSSEDRLITRKVAMALKTIDVNLHDHIIVGDGYYSFSEEGLMKDITAEFDRIISQSANH